MDAMRYKNTIQVDFSLSGAVPELKVPVRITVPIPENVNPEFFHVLHYSNDGTYEDIWPLEIDREARTASFTVTHFSTFVLAEERTEEDKPVLIRSFQIPSPPRPTQRSSRPWPTPFPMIWPVFPRRSGTPQKAPSGSWQRPWIRTTSRRPWPESPQSPL